MQPGRGQDSPPSRAGAHRPSQGLRFLSPQGPASRKPSEAHHLHPLAGASCPAHPGSDLSSGLGAAPPRCWHTAGSWTERVTAAPVGPCLTPAPGPLGSMAGSVAPRLSLLPVLLVLAAAADPPPAGEVWQSPLYAVPPEGGSISISCSVHTNGTLLGVHLKQGHLPEMLNMAYQGTSTQSMDRRFVDRVLFSGPLDRLTVTVQRLQPEDSGAYFCEAIMEEGRAWGNGTTVVVTAASACPGTQLAHFTFPVVLALSCLLILLGLTAMCVLRRRRQMRSLCSARDRSAVTVIYEDMSCSRRNTLSVPLHSP